MAKLLKQRRMVKILNDFYKNTHYSSANSYSIRINNIAQDAIPEADHSQAFFQKRNLRNQLTYLFRKKYFDSPNYQLDRASRNNMLYRSCLDDGFIEEVFDENKRVSALLGNSQETSIPKSKIGIRVSNKGSDLLHILGFIELAFKKYPTGKLIVYTIIATMFSTAVLGAIIIKVVLFYYSRGL